MKYRILSNSGHLSNEDCAKTVVKLMENGCDKIVLCHLSKENNEPELALGSVHLELQNNNLSLPESTVLRAASRFAPDEWLVFLHLPFFGKKTRRKPDGVPRRRHSHGLAGSG